MIGKKEFFKKKTKKMSCFDFVEQNIEHADIHATNVRREKKTNRHSFKHTAKNRTLMQSVHVRMMGVHSHTHTHTIIIWKNSE